MGLFTIIASIHFLTLEEHGNITGTAEPRIINMKETNNIYVTDELESITVMAEVQVTGTEDRITILQHKITHY